METNLTVNDPIKNFVKNNSRSTEVFEELGIDFCCGGDMTLHTACEEKHLQPDEVYHRLMDLKFTSATSDEDVSALNPTELADHLEATHHVYLKLALPRVTELMAKVHQAHSSRHPELTRLQTVLESLREDLEPHLLKEERVLFPMIRQLHSQSMGLEAAQGPIHVMRYEHDQVGKLLKEMRTLANDYVAPDDGCASFNLLYEELKQLEGDTHLHIYKENNLLFSSDH